MMVRLILPILVLLLMAGCGYGPRSINVKPEQEPMFNFTQSSVVLNCVGNYIKHSRYPAIDVYISDIPDHTVPSIETGFLTKNAVMMATTAVDRLGTEKVAIVGRNGGRKDRRQIQILGSFTELNRTTKSNALSGQAIIPGGFEVEFGADKNFNHIALDLAMSESNRIVPGTATSMSIQIHGKSGDATLTYDEGDDFAAIGALGFTGQEGFHSAERLLIETAVALMMSRYFDINIKNCLQRSKKKSTVPVKSDYDTPVFPSYPGSDPLGRGSSLTVSQDYFQPYQATRQPAQTRSPRPKASSPLTVYDGEGKAVSPESEWGAYTRDDYIERFEVKKDLPTTNGLIILPGDNHNRYLYEQP